ncbi:MAG TPA: transglutaminaseTgpA domain-containing protein [Ilumatobacteraceae bacterium]|nr:transglutaminaseTgpA domain-containing protein [Ilumatobacteraceae bacterium]
MTSTVRPSGWSPGTGTMLGAWLASAAIARLTGAAAVILLLATARVAMVFEIVAGWRSTRSAPVRSVVAPTIANVGEAVELLVGLDAPTSTRAIEHRRITVTLTDGTVVSLPPGATRRAGTADEDSAASKSDTISARFDRPGVVAALTVRVDVAGPAGLIWWKRTHTIAIDPLHVAPIAVGPLVAVESSASTSEGSVTARRGNHGGEIDGVRPWRQGDATNSVHWVSSLRTDELIVHDRLTASDQHWLVDLDAAEPSRLRWTLDEGRRHGHDVAVRTGDGARHVVGSEDDAARWSAIAAQAQLEDDAPDRGSGRVVRRSGILHRPIRLQPPAIVSATPINAPARWAAAAAAFASMAMLVGAINASGAMLVLVFAAVVAGAAVSLWVARRSGRRPLLMQVAIVGAILVALAVIAGQAVDVDGLLAALRGPLPNVLMLLMVLHGFEAVDRRTLRVHLAITFVLTSYAAGLRIDGALGWWLAAWSVPFVLSLLTTLRESGRGAARRGGGPGVSGRQAARPRPSAAGSMRSTGRWIVSFAAIGAATLAVLSLVPIPDGPARLGLPALSSNAPTVDSPGGLARPDGSASATADGNPDRALAGGVVGYPGFTETLDTSIRGDLGDEIVMRVRAPEPAFWRGQTFTEFDGRTWTVSPELGQRQDGPVIDVQPTIGDALGAVVPNGELVQTYFVEQDLPNVVFAAPRPVQVIFDGSLWTRPDGALRSDVTLTAGSVYTVISERPQVDADILRAQGDLGEFFSGFREVAGGGELDPFLALPESTTQRTIDLATSLRTPGESTYDTILAYEEWLGTNTEYDLDAPVPAEGADAVDDFLFESQLGFCEQIASTLTIMLRSQGVPARLATGYVPGERDRVSGVWNVRGSDAHAWVEVWFPQTGWQPFDPTAEVPLAADAGGETVGGDLIGAMFSSIGSYHLQLGLVALAAAIAWGVVSAAALARYRRRRGRWGLLQDRFGALANEPSQAAVVATNAHIASTFTHADHAACARTVADELDRAGFDPSWVDDDDRYERARSALATLERTRR